MNAAADDTCCHCIGHRQRGLSACRRNASLHRQEIHQQQALCIVKPNTAVAFIEHLGQQVKTRDNLAELDGETQVAALLRYFVGKQQQDAICVLALAEQPGGFFDIARGIADELRVDRVADVELSAPTVGGHYHAADGINEGADPVAFELRAQGVAQRGEVATVSEGWQGTTLLDRLTNLPRSAYRIRVTRLAPLVGVAQVELVHEQIQALQVVAHAQGRHAIDTGLEELIGLAIAELLDDVPALLLGAPTGAEH